MTIEVKINFTTMEEAAEALARMSMGAAPTMGAVDSPEVQDDPTSKSKPKRARKPKAEAPAEEPKQNIQESPEDRTDPDTAKEEAAAEAKPAESGMSDEAAEKMFLERVRPAMTELMAAAGQEKTRSFLTEFGGLGLKKISELPKERYAEFIEKAKEEALNS
jgi:outer membrane biosynthesis protein TonB